MRGQRGRLPLQGLGTCQSAKESTNTDPLSTKLTLNRNPVLSHPYHCYTNTNPAVRMEVMNRKNYLRNLRRPFLFSLYLVCFVKTLILRSFQLKQKYYTNCGYKHVKTTHVLKKNFD